MPTVQPVSSRRSERSSPISRTQGNLGRRLEEIRRLEVPGRELAFGEALTDRELAVLKLLPSQLSQRAIAAELFLSLNTVKSHSRAIYRKLGASSREEAIERARELALI